MPKATAATMTAAMQASTKIFMTVHLNGSKIGDLAESCCRECATSTARRLCTSKEQSAPGQLRGAILQELQQAEASCRWRRFGRFAPQAKGCGAPAPN